MNRGARDDDLADLDILIETIVVDVYDDNEQFSAFRQAFEDDVPMPTDAFVIGESVSVIALDYDGNERRGLTARCLCEDSSEYIVAAPDLEFPQGSIAHTYIVTPFTVRESDGPFRLRCLGSGATGTAFLRDPGPGFFRYSEIQTGNASRSSLCAVGQAGAKRVAKANLPSLLD